MVQRMPSPLRPHDVAPPSPKRASESHNVWAALGGFTSTETVHIGRVDVPDTVAYIAARLDAQEYGRVVLTPTGSQRPTWV